MTGSMGATTISATLGGGVLIDATAVREVQFDTGSGTVPAIGTTITQGGASGYLLGVWADLNSAPTAVGAAMPATGFIKFREVTGSLAAGALVGIGANATGADTTSWIEVVQRQAVANTVPRLGYFRTRGAWYTLPQTTNGTAGQVIQIPTNGGGAGTHVPAVWIETGVGTNVYEAFPAVLSTWFIPANLGTDARAKFVQTIGTGQVRIGNNGTDDVGFVPPDGCRIRIPNILGRQSPSAGDDAVNQVPHVTVGTRPDWTTTSSGDIDFEYFMNDWYHLFTSPYKVRLMNCATFDILSTSNNAAAIDLNNFVTGNYIAATPLTLTANSLGGTIQNCKFFRPDAASNGHVANLSLCADYTFTNCHFGVITFARSTGRSISTSQCTNIVFNDNYQYNAYTQHATSFNITMNGLDHCDRFVGDTNTTTGMYSVAVLTSSNNVIVDGLTFGLKGTLSGFHNPYLSPFYTINSSNVVFRNAGTRAAPLAVASAALGPQYAVHDAGANTNVKAQRIYLEHTRTSAFLTLNTSKEITFESVHGTVGSLQTLALNTLVKGVRSASNSVTGGAAVYGTHVFDMFESDTAGRLWFAMNEPTAFSDSLVTLTRVGSGGGFTSAGQVSMPTVGDELIIEMPYFALGHTAFAANSLSPFVTGTNPANFSYEYAIDKGSGFGGLNNLMKLKVRGSGGTSGTNTVTVAATESPMPEIGDLALTETVGQIPVGTTITNVVGNVITLSANFTSSFTGNFYSMRALPDEVISPSDGFKLRIRIVCARAATTNALTYVRLNTVSTLAAQTSNLYSTENTVQVTLSGLKPNTEVRVYEDDAGDNGAYVAGVENSGTSFSFNVLENRTINIMINNLGYLPADIWQFDTGTTNSFVPVSQFIDRQYFNG